jgi:hypothetical protein
MADVLIRMTFRTLVVLRHTYNCGEFTASRKHHPLMVSHKVLLPERPDNGWVLRAGAEHGGGFTKMKRNRA